MAEGKSNRSYKDGIFRRLFSSREKILELYNAIEGSDYTDVEMVQVQTLEDAIYNVYKNDLAFTIGDKFVILIEHQSTVSVNITVRMLIYLARVYEKLLPKGVTYRERPVTLQTPSMYVLYNGEKEQPMNEELRLSELYAVKECDVSLELKVRMININYEVGAELLGRSRTINEYSHFVYLVRCNMKSGMDRDEAIKMAIGYCIRADILRDFLEENGTEVNNMLLNEFNVEDYGRVRKEEGKAEGEREGMLKGRREGRKEMAEDIAKKLREMGVDPAIIKEVTDINNSAQNIL